MYPASTWWHATTVVGGHDCLPTATGTGSRTIPRSTG